MDIVRVAESFLDAKGALFNTHGRTIVFQYSFHVHEESFDGWFSCLAPEKFEVGFSIAPVKETAILFVQALPEFDKSLFLRPTEQDGWKDFTWESGRQYAGSEVAVKKALPLIVQDAEEAIVKLRSYFEAEATLTHPLTPGNAVRMLDGWSGTA